jgi:hypothetical protein
LKEIRKMDESRAQVLNALKEAADHTKMTIIAESDGTIRYATGEALGRLGLARKDSVTAEMMDGISTAITRQHPIQRETNAHQAVFSPVNGQGFVVISFDPIFPEAWNEDEYNRACAALQSIKLRANMEDNHG